jgi:hypothetical protein
MLVLRSMKNQEGGHWSHNMIETLSNVNQQMIRLPPNQKSVGQNQDFLDVKTRCNEWIIY